MTPLFKKLNYKSEQNIICINAPKTFHLALNEMKEFAKIKLDLKNCTAINFIMVFVTKQEELNNYINEIAPKLIDDAILWICYPKQSSKKYTCEFNRDTGWELFGTYNLEPVRGVAIDEDWSALRFRKIEFIKNFNRKSGALSEAGKERIKK